MRRKKSTHEPNLAFALGGKADFRGRPRIWYAMLSAPGVHFALQTFDVEYLLPRPQLVKGSAFAHAAWVLRDASGARYGLRANASSMELLIVDLDRHVPLHRLDGPWQRWRKNGIFVLNQQFSTKVEAWPWEVVVTRHPVRHWVAGPRVRVRVVEQAAPVGTCFPHGILGQSWNGKPQPIQGVAMCTKAIW